MHKKGIAIIALAAFAAPALVSAHQVAVYDIGGERYQLVVGSLNEPIAVDDNTGVEFRVSMPEHSNMAAGEHHAAGGAVTGLENTLRVELIAGDKKRELDLRPAFGEPGAYYAKFYPTVATTLSYRFFGEINGTPVDLTFTCRGEGAPGAEEGEKDISAGITQVSKTGGYDCPADKTSLGFPEESAPVADIAGDAAMASSMSVGALALAAVALAVGFVRRRS